MTRRNSIRATLALSTTLFLSATAQAQLFRAYLASVGNDANPCTLAAPCRLLPAALTAVASGGEIWMLDSANYNSGTVTIGKSASILAVPGAVGSIVALNGGPAKSPNALAGISKVSFEIPQLHNVVHRAPPVVEAKKPEKAIYDLNWLSASGTAIFLAALLSALWLRIPPGTFVRQFGTTLVSMRWALLTIACMLALAYTTKYCGSDATLWPRIASPRPVEMSASIFASL